MRVDRALISGLAVAAVAGGMTLSPAYATGNLYTYLNASQGCRGQSGFGAQAFYAAERYIENTTASTQYLLCSQAHFKDSSQPYVTDGSQGFWLSISWTNTASVPAPLSCAAVMGYLYPSGTASSNILILKSATASAGGGTSLEFSPSELKITDYWPTVNVSCAVPGGGRVNYMASEQPKNF